MGAALSFQEVDPSTPRGRLLRRYTFLKTERSYYTSWWMDLNDFMIPRSARFFVTNKNRGNLKNQRINDGTATLALRALSAGMMSGVTNPARPWFQLKAINPSLNERYNVKCYLEEVRKRVCDVFLKSNLYTTLPLIYTDLGCFGTGCFEVMEDQVSVIRTYHRPIGSYTLGLDERLCVDTNFYEMEMTAHQLVEKFGFDQCTIAVKNAYKMHNIDANFIVYHAIERNPDYNPKRMESKFKKFKSWWWEASSLQDEWLQEAGFDTFPVIAPRWDVCGEDTYGSSPGMDAWGDTAALQLEQKRKQQIIEKYVNPPLQAPVGMRNTGAVTNLPGGITWVDAMQQQTDVKATYQTNLQGMNFLTEDIREVQNRINSMFYKDLFLMIAETDKDATAYEIAARQEEKLLALGPVYLRLNDEMLDPLLERTLDIMTQKSLPYWRGLVNGVPPLPPPPPEMIGQSIAFEYISIMAQAMKAVGVASIEKSVTFLGGMAQAFPGVLDNLNSDKLARSYMEMTGVPPELLTSEQARDSARRQKMQQAQQQQALASANSAADTAQKLGNTPLDDNNALAQLMSRMGGGQAQPQGAPQ